MRKLPNGDALHHLKNNKTISTSITDKDKESLRGERGKSLLYLIIEKNFFFIL